MCIPQYMINGLVTYAVSNYLVRECHWEKGAHEVGPTCRSQKKVHFGRLSVCGCYNWLGAVPNI